MKKLLAVAIFSIFALFHPSLCPASISLSEDQVNALSGSSTSIGQDLKQESASKAMGMGSAAHDIVKAVDPPMRAPVASTPEEEEAVRKEKIKQGAKNAFQNAEIDGPDEILENLDPAVHAEEYDRLPERSVGTVDLQNEDTSGTVNDEVVMDKIPDRTVSDEQVSTPTVTDRKMASVEVIAEKIGAPAVVDEKIGSGNADHSPEETIERVKDDLEDAMDRVEQGAEKKEARISDLAAERQEAEERSSKLLEAIHEEEKKVIQNIG